MSYESCVKTWQRLREEHRDNPNPKVQAVLRNFAVDFGTERVSDVLHTSFIAWLAVENARLGRSMTK